MATRILCHQPRGHSPENSLGPRHAQAHGSRNMGFASRSTTCISKAAVRAAKASGAMLFVAAAAAYSYLLCGPQHSTAVTHIVSCSLASVGFGVSSLQVLTSMPCAQLPDPNSTDTTPRDLLRRRWLCCLILQLERCNTRKGYLLFQPDANGQAQTGTAAPYHAHQVQQVLLHQYPWCRVLSLAVT